MSDVNVRSESVDVEQIMRQIRARIREKRGVDYTEAELQQLANVKLEKFLDPRGIRSDLLQHFQQRQTEAAPPNYTFETDTLFESHRPLVRAFRSLFRPILKLFINVDKLSHSLHLQSNLNENVLSRLRRVDDLTYELLHNMTLEVTRLGVEVHNLKMRVESLTSRLDFDERRTKAFESVVQYRPSARPSARPAPAPAAETASAEDTGQAGDPPAGGDEAGGDRRRRRRRRRRRPGGTLAESQAQDGQAGSDDGADEGEADEAGIESSPGGEAASSDDPERGQ